MNLGKVTCPRCDREVNAGGIWLWVNGRGERLQVENYRIKQSGHCDLFDLPCGCKFDTTLWILRVTGQISVSTGSKVWVFIEPVTLPEVTSG